MTYRIGGQVVDQGSGVSGQPVFVVDTADADPTNWTVEAATTTAADGSWSVVVPSGNVERYHAVTQVDDGGTLKNSESKPYLTAHPELRPARVDIQFNVPAPQSIGSGIPDSGEYQWPVDEGSGKTLNPRVGSVTATINGATWQSDAAAIGGQRLSFDGTDDDVVTDSQIGARQSQFTVFGWVRLQDYTSFGNTLFAAGDGDNDGGDGGWYISTDGTELLVAAQSGGTLFPSVPFVPSGNWGFLALILDGDTTRLITFSNSQELADQSGTRGRGRQDGVLRFGSKLGTARFANADLGIFGATDSKLTKTQITDFWKATQR